MHYLDFIAKDKSWNNYMKVNEYLFLNKYFWIIINGIHIAWSKEINNAIPDELIVPDDLYSNLTNFASTMTALVDFLDRYVNMHDKLTKEDIAYLLTVDKDSMDYDEEKMNKILQVIRDKSMMSNKYNKSIEKHNVDFESSLRDTYSRMISTLDESIEILDRITGDESNSFVHAWSKYRDTFLKDEISKIQNSLEDSKDMEGSVDESEKIRFPIPYIDKTNEFDIYCGIEWFFLNAMHNIKTERLHKNISAIFSRIAEKLESINTKV